MAVFKTAKSFRIYDETDSLSELGDQAGYDVLRLPLAIQDDGYASDSGSRSSSRAPAPSRAKMNLARLELDSFGSNALSDAELNNTAARLAEIHARTNAGGIALRCGAVRSPRQLNYLLEILYCQGVPVLLLDNHDSDIWKSVNLGNVAGIIMENATILPNGQRRDYFRAGALRDVMARCSKERETRTELFIGFLELWDQRPHPAVVRRSVKLAEHFGAVVEHGPAKEGNAADAAVKSASQTLSGFEYLRRGALIEVSQSYSKTAVAHADSDDSFKSSGAQKPGKSGFQMAPRPLRWLSSH
jgi:hypothetical protein